MGRAQRPIRGRGAPVPRTMNNRVNRAGTAFAPRRWRTRFALLALIKPPPGAGGAEQTGRDVSRLGERRPPAEGVAGAAPPRGRGAWPPPDFRSG